MSGEPNILTKDSEGFQVIMLMSQTYVQSAIADILCVKGQVYTFPTQNTSGRIIDYFTHKIHVNPLAPAAKVPDQV